MEVPSTPCLMLDLERARRNIDRMNDRLRKLGVPLRPHLKTAKCIEVARLLMASHSGPATVSTLAEAEAFASLGVRDILYAVGIVPAKLPRVLSLREEGIDLAIVLDSPDQARAVAEACNKAKVGIPVLIEIDCDGHRSGIRPGDPVLLEVANILHSGGAELRGVMTHAGGSYNHRADGELTAAAEQERLAAVTAALELRREALPCPIVSVGSTPTALFAEDLTGVTEVRAGVFVFMDLVMVGLGVCTIDDIALSVCSTVIGHQRDKGWIIVDAGWMAMSGDRGTGRQSIDQGYGVVCDFTGRPYPDLLMGDANQEHGILALRAGSNSVLPELPIGSVVRILPNHACATAAQFNQYNVIDQSGAVFDHWSRFSGW